MPTLPAGEVRYTILDSSDNTAIMSRYVRTSAELAEVRAAALAELGRIESLTLGSVQYFTVGYEHVIHDELAPAGAMRERRAVLVFETSSSDQYAVIVLPTLRPDIPDEFGVIDLAHPAIAALAAGLTSGAWCNPFGHQITTLIAAHYEFMP